ncbi:MAG: hypothetical protein HPY30_00875 [Gammaproteobacteria bacterium (ex Lamellibrachia satsuma)]|nr:MAG: hypothetical protein HPY30_00875 [Gammaproteobacteria bacterium (ex Lamellibrachia satsuma)]
MTTQFNQQSTDNTQAKGNQPTHVAKVRHGHGKGATYERIGVAWVNEEGAVYVKLHGTQIVSAFTLYELPQAEITDE